MFDSVSFADVKHEYRPLNNKLLFKPGNVEVELSAIVINKTGALLFNPNGQKPIGIYADRKNLAQQLRSLADRLDPPQSKQIEQPKAEQITPADDTPMHLKKGQFPTTPAEVISYFYNSPVLAGIAPDVEASLKPYVDAYMPSDVDLVMKRINPSDLFDEDGKPVWGAQSQIANALGISNAGSHRGRILSVLTRLQNSTTFNSSTMQKIAA